MQKIYSFVLSKTYILTGKIDERKRNVIIGILLFCIALNSFLYTGWYFFGISVGYTELLISNAVLLVLVIIFSAGSRVEEVNLNKWIVIPWVVCFSIIILSGFHHNITGALLFSSFIALFVFPCLFCVWISRGDVYVLYRISCKAFLAAFLLFFIYHVIMIPLNDPNTAYYGISVNPNSNGFIGLAGAMSSLYLICIDKSKWQYAYMITLGMASSFIYISLSRASVIALLVSLLIFIVWYLRKNIGGNENIKRTVLFLIAILFITIISMVGYKNIFLEITPKTNEFIISNGALNVYASETDNVEDPLLNKFKKGNDIITLSSGRIEIWREYIKNLNFIGNDREELGLYIESLGRNASAHNSYIEISYRCGIVAGLLYAYIAIYAAIYALRLIFNRKKFNSNYLFIPMSVMAFGILSNLERAIYPLEKIYILMFFLALIPMFGSKIENPSKKTG